MKISGIVEGITARPNRDGLTTYAVKVDGKFFSFYTTKPSCATGAQVEFEYTQKGDYYNADPRTLAVLSAAPTKAAAAAIAAVPDNRQQSIVMQSSHKTAADLLSTLLAAGALKLPAAQAKIYDAVLAVYNDLVLQVYKQCSNPEAFLRDNLGPESVEEDADYDPSAS